MKAILVKDDNFTTIGLEIRNNAGGMEYSWGVCALPSRYTKELDAKEHEETMLHLIMLGERLKAAESLESDFVQMAGTIKELDHTKGFSFDPSYAKNKVNMLKRQIKTIIDNLK